MPFSGRFRFVDTRARQKLNEATSHLAELGSKQFQLLRLPHTGQLTNGHWGRLLEPHAAVKVPDNLAESRVESVCDVIGLS